MGVGGGGGISPSAYMYKLVCLVNWGLTPQQQQGHIEAVMMMMKCQFQWWWKLEHPEETTDLRQVTDKLSRIRIPPTIFPHLNHVFCILQSETERKRFQLRPGDGQMNRTRERGSLWKLFRENTKTFLIPECHSSSRS